MRLPPRLLALTPGTLRAGLEPALLAACSAALEGGLRGVLLREPGLDERAFLALARELRRLLDGVEGGWLGVHDRGHLALLCGADGLHLGFRSLAPAIAREHLDRSIALGVSAHEGDDPRAVEPADYLLLGPVLDTPSKRGLKEPLGFEALAREAARLARPAWAIGGLQPEHAARALAAGCRGVAVRAAVFGAPDPARAVAAFARELPLAGRVGPTGSGA